MKKILVTGAAGQLGSELQQLSGLYAQYHFYFMDSKSLPIDREDLVADWFALHKPDYCINCAAYTAVDRAESEPEKAMLVNGTAVGYLAKAADAQHCRLFHISTDYVFDGTATSPLKEDEKVNPLGVYGGSKLAGEESALRFSPETIIIRTSWVYSAFGNNFVKTMQRLMTQRKEISVVNDQLGSPTYAADLARALMNIIGFLEEQKTTTGFGGVYHYSNKGVITWYEFATAIREMIHSDCTVHPIPTSAYPTPAKRPAYSVMDMKKIHQTFGIDPMPWKESLQICLLQLQQYLA